MTMICRKSLQLCQTPGMCAPHGGCADPAQAPGWPELAAAIATLNAMGYTYNGGQRWKPPVGKKPDFGLIDRLRCQLEVSEDTRQVLRKCLAQAESEIDALRDMKLPHFLHLSDDMRAAGDHAVSRAREDGCASVPVLYGVFFEAAIQRWLNDQEEIIEAAEPDDRAAFEASFKRRHPQYAPHIDLARDADGNYKYQPASVEWPVWQAARRPAVHLPAKTPAPKHLVSLTEETARLSRNATIDEVAAMNDRPAGCCCPPPGHTGIWGAGMCPVHQGLRRQVL